MARIRIRTVKAEFWEEEPTATLSFPARLLACGMVNYADDEGLLAWSAQYLRGSLFRYDEDVSLERVLSWMKEIEDRGLVYVYTSTRVRHRIAFIVGMRKGPLSQRVDKPSPASLPVPNWHDPAVILTYARRDDYMCRHCNEPVNESFSQDPALSEFNPACERIKQPSERFHSADDPTNIATVHVGCAKDRGPDGGRAPLAAIPGPFRDHSENAPGTVVDRSGGPLRPGSPVAQHVRALPSLAAAPRVLTGEVIPSQSIPRTFHESSTNDSGAGQPPWQQFNAPAEPTGPVTLALPGLDPAPDQAPRKNTGKRGRTVDPETARRRKSANELTAAWWEALEIKPSGRNAFIAAKKIVESLLEAGHDPRAIATAAGRCDYAMTRNGMEYQLRRLAEQAERAGDAQGGGVMRLADFGRRPATTDVRLAQASDAFGQAAQVIEQMRHGRTG